MNNTIALNQLKSLPLLFEQKFENIDHNIRNTLNATDLIGIKQVFVVGNGDSYFAGLAVTQIFNKFTDVQYKAVQSMKFFAYEHTLLKEYSPGQTLIIGVSASGESKRVVQALEEARKSLPSAKIFALVGNVESSVAGIADKILDVSIPNEGTAPGIRSYVASLFGLLGVALRIGELQGKIHLHDANRVRAYIPTLAPIAERITNTSIEVSKNITSLVKSPILTVVGSGCNFGNALFNAAKFVEIAGLHATGQDIEEWLHVERFAYPLDSPIMVIASSGEAFNHAKKMIGVAKAIGHQIICITNSADDSIISRESEYIVNFDDIEELYSVFITFIPSIPFAIAYGNELNRNMFMSDNENIKDARNKLNKLLKETM
ncbi:MAG: SIS domain-containing protein [Peptostreptococcales bacterium]